ncbi:MAG: hypothetical protein KZY61_11140 [Clostridiaceae bacterium]|nr:hypothetical protein [Clostridiaceae bacterium]MBW4860211.1 hypothetical protein [Clostridiaceae bacterium]MBW4869188.1 hypothetical protein [Clostridiaceae bacterium]
MKRGNLFIVISILLCTLILLLTLNYYNVYQNFLIFESNDLYSKNNITVEQSYEDIISNEKLNDVSFRIFYYIGNDTDGNIRAYFSNDYNSWIPPLKKGRFFRNEDTKEAIVGKNVKLKKIGQNDFFILNDKQYRVIGYFGISENSFLDNSVLINDIDFFKLNDPPYVIDGEEINNVNLKVLRKGYVKDAGIRRVLETDFFTPIILIFSKMIIIGGICLASYLYFLKNRKENFIKHVIGKSRWSNLKRDILFLTILFFICFVIMFIFKILFKFQVDIGLLIKESAFCYILLILTYFSLFIYERRKAGGSNEYF